MSPSLSLILLWFIVKSVDLLCFGLSDDLTNDFGTLNEWAANLGLVSVDNRNDFGQFDLRPGFAVELLDDQNVALSRGVLLPAGLYDCLHLLKSPEIQWRLGAIRNYGKKRQEISTSSLQTATEELLFYPIK